MSKKIYIIVILILVLGAGVLYFGGFLNSSKPIGQEGSSPKNYEECISFGGKTNKNEMRVQDTCEYNGEIFVGATF